MDLSHIADTLGESAPAAIMVASLHRSSDRPSLHYKQKLPKCASDSPTRVFRARAALHARQQPDRGDPARKSPRFEGADYLAFAGGRQRCRALYSPVSTQAITWSFIINPTVGHAACCATCCCRSLVSPTKSCRQLLKPEFQNSDQGQTHLIILESPNSMTFERQQDLAAVAELARSQMCDLRQRFRDASQ
ncbi:MAG: hypothetical protein IPP82_04950 [Xanthomonadales bacterium]|nr:hypothetical protein [Xanthomonadales bacterium]